MLKKWKSVTMVGVFTMGMLVMGNFVQAQKKESVPLNIIVWGGIRAEGPTRGLAKDYQKLNPHVKFNIEAGPYEDYTTRVAFDVVSGTNAYDLVWLDPKYLGGFVNAGYVEPLDRYLLEDTAWWEDFKGDVYRNVLYGPQNQYRCLYKGHWYALPSGDSNTAVFYYRKDVLAEAGIAKAPETWDEVFEAAEKVHRPPKMFAIANTYRRFWAWDTFMTYLYSAGGRLWDPETKIPRINDKAAIRAAEVYKETFKWVPKDALNWGEELLHEALAKSGTIAMSPVAWANPVPTDPNLSAFAEVTVAKVVPRLDGNARPAMAGFFWIMSTRSRFKDEAWNFLKFEMSRENNEKRIEYGGQPCRISALLHPKAVELGKPYFQVLADSLETAGVRPTDPEFIQAEQIMGKELVDILMERKSIKQALDDAQAAIWQVFVGSGRFEPEDVPPEYRK